MHFNNENIKVSQETNYIDTGTCYLWFSEISFMLKTLHHFHKPTSLQYVQSRLLQ